MKTIELAKKLEGKTLEEQAKLISSYYAAATRKQQTEAYRASVRNKCFVGCKRLNKSQQVSYLYEFLNANNSYISNWMTRTYPDIKES